MHDIILSKIISQYFFRHFFILFFTNYNNNKKIIIKNLLFSSWCFIKLPWWLPSRVLVTWIFPKGVWICCNNLKMLHWYILVLYRPSISFKKTLKMCFIPDASTSCTSYSYLGSTFTMWPSTRSAVETWKSKINVHHLQCNI